MPGLLLNHAPLVPSFADNVWQALKNSQDFSGRVVIMQFDEQLRQTIHPHLSTEPMPLAANGWH
jgi:hypothetical protein